MHVVAGKSDKIKNKSVEVHKIENTIVHKIYWLSKNYKKNLKIMNISEMLPVPKSVAQTQCQKHGKMPENKMEM